MCCFKEDSTQHIFRMEEEEVEDENPGEGDDNYEKWDEIVVLRAQNDESEVRFQEKQAVFEKMHNSVVGHLGVDRSYKALKLLGHERRPQVIYLGMYYLPEVNAVGFGT